VVGGGKTPTTAQKNRQESESLSITQQLSKLIYS
jgi:hypothetical protein